MSKVILITGASSGMGKETARDLIAEGHTVYAAARSLDKMKDLEDLGGKVIHLDISDEASVAACVDQIIAEQGHIDVLWNNAGFGLFGSVEETTIDDARYQFDVNLFGLARLTQLITPHMRERREGLIINTSSVGGKVYTPLGAWYHATKHALEGFSDCLRFELEPHGVKVVVLEPGAIQTDFGNVMNDGLMKRSGTGPYKGVAIALKNMTEKEMNQGGGSPTSLISKTVRKIIAAKNPRTRYLVGKYAKPMAGIRKWGGDRIFDKVLRGMVK